jgi:CRP-like cAMP-binding protein
VQVAAVGRRGVIGISPLLGVQASPFDVVAGYASAAYRVPIESVLWSMRRDPAVTAVLLRYVQSRIVVLSQGSACHRMHTLDQRTARWLLETSDELDGAAIQTTHGFMADLLGVQRPRLSEALDRLRTQGISTPARGMIVVSDHERLERVACSCYELLRTYARDIVDAEIPALAPLR